MAMRNLRTFVGSRVRFGIHRSRAPRESNKIKEALRIRHAA